MRTQAHIDVCMYHATKAVASEVCGVKVASVRADERSGLVEILEGHGHLTAIISGPAVARVCNLEINVAIPARDERLAAHVAAVLADADAERAAEYIAAAISTARQIVTAYAQTIGVVAQRLLDAGFMTGREIRALVRPAESHP